MRKRFNVRFALYLLVTLIVVAVGTHFLHAYQVRRNAGGFLARADQAEQDGQLSQAADYLGRYLSFNPDDLDTQARFGMLLADERVSQSPRAKYRAMMALERVLLRQPDRHDLRRQSVRLAVALGLCLLTALGCSRTLDALTLGEDTARSLGQRLTLIRLLLIATLSLATGAAVAQCGLIAFVGLVAPHLVRSWGPTTHGALLLLSALTGGALLLAADIAARWVIAPQELPVGIITALLGGSYLLWLMHRRKAHFGGAGGSQ